MSKHLLHVKSDVLLDDGTPKLPTADQVEYGELALNYLKGYETISLKNTEDEIVKFGNEVEIGNETPSAGSNVEIFIDESVESLEVNLYTKKEIDNKIDLINTTLAELQSSIDSITDKINSIQEVIDGLIDFGTY